MPDTKNLQIKTIMIMAMTVDGKIAKETNQCATDWTSSEDTKHFREVSKEHKAIIIGNRTFKTFPAPLPGRLNIVYTSTPEKYDSPEKNTEYTNKNPNELLSDLSQRGYKSVMICGGTKINSLFLKNNLIDEIYLTIEPKIFGKGLDLCTNLPQEISLSLKEHKLLNDNTILLIYKVEK